MKSSRSFAVYMQWSVVDTPGVHLEEIRRERCCQGRVYVLWWRDDMACAFVCQSLPVLTAFLSEVGKRSFHASSFYRSIRRESRSTWSAASFKCTEVLELNERLRGFGRVFFVVRNPEGWVIRLDGSRTGPGSACATTPGPGSSGSTESTETRPPSPEPPGGAVPRPGPGPHE